MEQDADDYKLSVLPTSSSQQAVIVVQFQKEEQRNAILGKGKKLKLDGRNCNISNSTSRIYINEDLSREVRDVFKYARELKKEGFKNAALLKIRNEKKAYLEQLTSSREKMILRSYGLDSDILTLTLEISQLYLILLMTRINDCTVLKVWPTKKRGEIYQALLEVDCATYPDLLGQGSVLVNVDNCVVYDALGLKICFKCCGLNHSAKDCKKSEQICIKCAGNHKVSECNSAQFKCKSRYTHISNIDEACDQFYRILYSAINRSVPRTLPRNNRYPPWFSASIIFKIKKKRNLWKKFKRTDHISFLSLNIRSIFSRFNDFKTYINNSDIDKITLTETWLNNHYKSDTVTIDKYNLLSADRNSRGGGVAIYIKKMINCRIIFSNISDCLEQLWIHMTNRAVYRPPSANVSICLSGLEDSIVKLLPTSDILIITGDLNINMLVSDRKTQLLYSFMECFLLVQLVDTPTRITSMSQTLIDVVMATTNAGITIAGTFDINGISDHLAVLFKICVPKIRTNIRFKTYRDYQHFDNVLFMEDLQRVNWDSIFLLDNGNDMLSFFNLNVVSVFDRHAPLRRVRLTKPPAPWLTQHAANDCRKG
nr:unnamed protein product [Callosobruchus chinensis]